MRFHLERDQSTRQKDPDCGGNACAVCGHCCDWNIVNGDWKSAPNATCTYQPPSRGFYYHVEYVCRCERKKLIESGILS